MGKGFVGKIVGFSVLMIVSSIGLNLVARFTGLDPREIGR